MVGACLYHFRYIGKGMDVNLYLENVTELLLLWNIKETLHYVKGFHVGSDLR